MYYVYAYIDPRDKEIFYIGKGTKNRYKQHLTDKKEYCHNKRLNGRIRIIKENNLEPEIKILKEFDNEDESYEYEEYLIKKYGRIGYDECGRLLNILESGRPPKYEKENHPWYGRNHSKETKNKISKSNKGKEPWNKGKKGYFTKEQLENIGWPKGKKFSSDHIEKLVESKKGYIHSDQTKNNIAKGNSDYWIITYPNGKTEKIFNLRNFCKENGLDQGNMMKVVKGICKQHKGFKVDRC